MKVEQTSDIKCELMEPKCLDYVFFLFVFCHRHKCLKSKLLISIKTWTSVKTVFVIALKVTNYDPKCSENQYTK